MGGYRLMKRLGFFVLGQKSVDLMCFRCATYGALEKGSAKYGPRAKSNPPPVFVNKILLEHSSVLSLMFCLWLLLCSMT